MDAIKARLPRLTGKETVAVITVILLGLIPLFTWFKPGYIIASQDFLPPFYPYEEVKNFAFIWSGNAAGYPPLLSQVLVFPFYSFWALFKAVGLGPDIIQRLWFVFFVLGSGLSMYYLVSALFPEKKYLIARVFAATFYMYNASIVSVNLFYFRMGAPLTYAFAPLILGLFIAGLKDGKKTRYALFIALASLLLVTVAANPPSYVIPWVLVIIYFVFHLVAVDRSGRERAGSLALLGKTAALCFLVNIWWLPALVVPLTTTTQLNLSTQIPELHEAISKSARSSFLEVFRLMGKDTWFGMAKFALNGKLAYYPYYIYASLYYKPVMILATYFIPVLAFCALLLQRRDNRVLLLAVLALVSIFLAKGFHPPLEWVNQVLYTYIPGLTMYREPMRTFNSITTLCYALLIGVIIATIYDYLKRYKTKLSYIASQSLMVLSLGAILASGWPVLTGAVNHTYVPGHSSVRIPSYWFDAADYINEQEGDYRVLLYPAIPEMGEYYDWGYDGISLARRFIYKSYIDVREVSGVSIESTEGYTALQLLTCSTIHQNTDTNLINLLGLLNVKYILQRNDLEQDYYESVNNDVDTPEHVRAVLTSREGIQFVGSFGKLDLYRVDDSYFTPHIYATNNTTYIYGDYTTMAELLQNNQLSQFQATFTSDYMPWDTFTQLVTPVDMYLDIAAGNVTENAINYSFGVSETGDYDIFIKLSPTFPVEEKLPLDGQEIRWWRIGEQLWTRTTLSEGIHTMSIPLAYEKYLLDPSFEEGVWEEAVDGFAGYEGTPTFSATQSTDAYHGRYSLSITTDMHEIGVHQNVTNFIPGAMYTISFWYKHIKGVAPRFSIWQYNVNKNALDEKNLPYEMDKWMHYENTFTVDPEATGIGVYFNSGSIGVKQDTENLYDNVKLGVSPGLAQIQIRGGVTEDGATPITYSQINPTKYQVYASASQPFVLVFSESYNSQWKAYVNREGDDTNWIEGLFQEPLLEDRHFLVNGYANAWFIDPEVLGMSGEDFSITLYYRPQSWYYFGIIVSGLILLSIIVSLFVILGRGKRRGACKG